MGRRLSLCLPVLWLVSCGGNGDPCQALLNYAQVCFGDAGWPAGSITTACQSQFATCNAQAKSELAAFYQCAANNHFCNLQTVYSTSCAQTVTAAAVTSCVVPACHGSPLPCQANSTAAACTAAPGCVYASCSGSAVGCNSWSGSQTDCAATVGCSWDAGTGPGTSQCTGTAALCSSFTTSSPCSAQIGCFFATSCSGTPTGACNGATQAACTAVNGCYWQ